MTEPNPLQSNVGTQRAQDVGMLRKKAILASESGIDFRRLANAPKEKPRTKRIEVDKQEYELLLAIAALAEAFMPVIEQTHIPVTRSREFEMLRTRLNDCKLIRTGLDKGDGAAVIGVADILRDLTNG
jgi:hypothetical protein